MKDKATKNKATSSHKTTEELKRWQLMIQDRVAGMSINEIAEAHKCNRHTVRKALDDHATELEAAQKAFLDERQERINTIIDQHNEQLADLLSKSTKNLSTMISKTETVINDPEKFAEMKPMEIARFLEASARTFDVVKSAVMNQQKEATK
jgi:transcriptional regulator of heat shock response